MHVPLAMSESADEWTYLTSDPEKSCAECGEPVRVAQAAGYVDGRVVHARCYRPRAADRDSDRDG